MGFILVLVVNHEGEVILENPTGQDAEFLDYEGDIPHIVLPQQVSLNNLKGNTVKEVFRYFEKEEGNFLFDRSSISDHFDGEITLSFALDKDGKEYALEFSAGVLVEIRAW